MLKAIRRRFNATGFVAVLALVFAMGGGAYAASRYVITSTKQISPKVLKALQGKPGAAGATGAQGPAGPAGEKGAPGANGTDGTSGNAGVSVTSVSVPTSSSTCSKLGGSEFTAAEGSKTTACNGKEGKAGAPGPAGPEGSPWTAGGTLPEGKSETGTWSNIFIATAAKQVATDSISFAIPLKAEPEAHFIENDELAGEVDESPAIKEGLCKGSYEHPEAKSGNLCVFSRTEGSRATDYLFEGAIPVHVFFTSPYGAIVATGSTEAGEVLAGGTWAVTG